MRWGSLPGSGLSADEIWRTATWPFVRQHLPETPARVVELADPVIAFGIATWAAWEGTRSWRGQTAASRQPGWHRDRLAARPHFVIHAPRAAGLPR
jgi:hypothetical protein